MGGSGECRHSFQIFHVVDLKSWLKMFSESLSFPIEYDSPLAIEGFEIRRPAK